MTAGWRAFGAFQLVGLATFVVGAGLMVVLDRLGVPYPVYTAVNYALSLGLGFVGNFAWTFRRPGQTLGTTALRYLVGLGALTLVVQGLQGALIEGWGWDHRLGVGAGMGVYAAGAWVVSRYWIFAPRRGAGAAATLADGGSDGTDGAGA